MLQALIIGPGLKQQKHTRTFGDLPPQRIPLEHRLTDLMRRFEKSLCWRLIPCSFLARAQQWVYHVRRSVASVRVPFDWATTDAHRIISSGDMGLR